MVADQVPVLAAPGIGPAAVWIREAGQAGLVPVVDGRGPGPGHLEQDSQPHDLHTNVLVRRVRSQGLRPPDDPVGPGQKAGVVVVGEFVHADPESGVGHRALSAVQDGLPEGVRVAVALIEPAVAVFFHAGQEGGHRFHEELIVHDGVPLVPLQPLPGVLVVFRQYDGVGIGLPDRLPEPLPEEVVELLRGPQVRGDVQPPAVRVVGRGDPFAPDLQDVIAQVLRLLVVELGQGPEIPPAVVAVIVWPLVPVKEKIIPVGGPL